MNSDFLFFLLNIWILNNQFFIFWQKSESKLISDLRISKPVVKKKEVILSYFLPALPLIKKQGRDLFFSDLTLEKKTTTKSKQIKKWK